MNRIAVVAMVKNEEDVIESFARHACSFADFVLIGDHHSTDQTVPILKSLQSEFLPIKIIDLKDQAYDHAAGLTNLMWRAIDLGADIIFTMDADEFIVQSNGNHESLRRAIQSLDPEKCYSMQWCNFELVEPEENADKFLLSRDFLREREFNTAPKVCVGAVAAKKTNLTIMKGGHHVILPEGISNEIPMPHEIFNAHFPRRSAGQTLSKTMCGWISHLLQFGRYTRFSYDWCSTNEDYIEKNIKPVYHLANPIEARELDGFRFTCENRYTRGNIEPLKNLYRIAENIAIEKFREDILKREELVRIYILFDGDVRATIDSLKTAIDQTYPFRKIFIIAVSDKNLDALFTAAEDLNLTETVGLINPDDPRILEDAGGFTQFITAGDKIYPDKIFKSIEAMYSDACPRFISVCLEKNENRGDIPDRIYHPLGALGDTLSLKDVSLIKELDCCFSAGLTGMFFRQEVLAGDMEFIRWICEPRIDVVQLKYILPIFARARLFIMMNEELVEKSRAWNVEDKIEFEKIRESL